ncbi:ATP-dependent helicase [Maledivibacter halophilus]|uniref:DNA 3'-5' helicase n=1 Tax=Maledivibacter halophilus TaxID=36842 RepID=A0A1T5MFJ5_9FIRM|nr:ATP-dependent helicase [Maledivibacter halophilus]SKC87021.1 DNA helicase-2 / ATP-dependent DNA helicase PcrA [Maledivibacter halophilus]
MRLLDKLTGKQQLLAELELLKAQNNQLLIEISEKKQAKKEIMTLQEDNRNLQFEKTKYKRELDELTDRIKEREEELRELKSKIDCFECSIKESAITLETYKEDVETTSKLINVYSRLYGSINIDENKKNKSEIVNKYDDDRVFFEDMRKKNDGNPFNQEQTEAIRYNKGHLRIVAGAGSGKTQTICAKAVYLNQMEDVDYKRICMITFTRKAATEMKERIEEFSSFDTRVNRMSIGTFNSVFKNIVIKELIRKNILTQNEIDALNIILPKIKNAKKDGSCEYEDIDSDKIQYNSILNKLIKKYGLDKFEELENDENCIADRISYWQSLNYSYEEVKQFIRDQYDDKYAKMNQQENDDRVSEKFYKMLNEFEKIRKEENIMVFDDQILNIYKALQLDSVKEYIETRFDYIFIDEFQDTNQLQIDVLKLLSPPDKENLAKVIIVGDPNQSIYAFRGSDSKYIQEFKQDYPSLYTINLMKNYRSKQQIVQKANVLISNNSSNKIPPMESHNKEDHECTFVKEFDCEEKESDFIIKKIHELSTGFFTYEDEESGEEIVDKSNPNYTKCSILYRAKHQVTRILQELEKRKIPFVIDEEIDLSIFKNKTFMKFFEPWIKLTDQNTDKNEIWFGKNGILKNLLNKYFVKSSSIVEYRRLNGISMTYDDVIKLIETKSNDRNLKNLGSERAKQKYFKKHKDNISKYLKYLTNIENTKDTNLHELLDCIMNFPATYSDIDDWKNIKNELQAFNTFKELYEWKNNSETFNKERKDKLKKYENKQLNAVYLLTIHKSKGLAFENVFNIGCYDGGIPSAKAQKNMSKEELEKYRSVATPISTIEEERRLMYVALTRAKKNVFVTYPTHVNSQAKKISVFISEIMSQKY